MNKESLTVLLMCFALATICSSNNLEKKSDQSEFSVIFDNTRQITKSEDYAIHFGAVDKNATFSDKTNLVKIINKFDFLMTILICCVFLLICFTCIFGNILVILSVFTYRPLQSVQNIFIVSLALADTFVAIFVMPFHVSSFLSNGKWLFSAFICHFFLTLDILLCTSSILHLCCIALDRYWAIKDSIKYAQKRTLKRVMVMIMIAWGLSALISLPVIIWNMKSVRRAHSEPSSSSSDYIRDEHRPNTTMLDDQIVCDIPHDKLYRFYSSSGTFFVPLLIMTFVYVRIYLETKRRLHERAKAAKKLAKSVANSSSHPPIAHAKQSHRKHIHSLKCFCCIQKNKNLVKVENDQALGAYLEQTDIGDEAQRSNRKTFDQEELEEKTVAFNRQSDKSKNGSSLNSPMERKKDFQVQSGHVVNKVSIGINTVSLGKEEEKEAEKSKRTDLIAGSEINRQNQVSSTWIRNPASSGTTLKQRQKISLTRERRAARTLGIIMGAFSICWFPFFIVYLLQSFDYFTSGYGLFEFLTWLGYVNSALNPIIYTVFNIDFRKSFERILFKCILFRR